MEGQESTLVVLATLVGIMTAFSALIWVAAEAIGAAFKLQKVGLAMVLGVAGGVILTGVGLFDVPGVESKPWEMAFGALLGLLCAVGASKGINDQIVNRFKPGKMSLLLALVLLPGLVGCAQLKPPSVEYVVADVQFEALMGPQIEAWIAADPDLSPNDRDALLVSLRAWRLMVKTAADDVGVPHQITRVDDDGGFTFIATQTGARIRIPASVFRDPCDGTTDAVCSETP